MYTGLENRKAPKYKDTSIKDFYLNRVSECFVNGKITRTFNIVLIAGGYPVTDDVLSKVVVKGTLQSETYQGLRRKYK